MPMGRRSQRARSEALFARPSNGQVPQEQLDARNGPGVATGPIPFRRRKMRLVWRIFRSGGPAFPSGAQDSCVIQKQVSESIISSPGLKRKRADRSVRVEGTRRVLDLVVDALGELRGQAYAFANCFKLARIGAALRRCKIDQRGADLSQRLGGTRFRLRRGIALPLGNDE